MSLATSYCILYIMDVEFKATYLSSNFLHLRAFNSALTSELPAMVCVRHIARESAKPLMLIKGLVAFQKTP